MEKRPYQGWSLGFLVCAVGLIDSFIHSLSKQVLNTYQDLPFIKIKSTIGEPHLPFKVEPKWPCLGGSQKRGSGIVNAY